MRPDQLTDDETFGVYDAAAELRPLREDTEARAVQVAGRRAAARRRAGGPAEPRLALKQAVFRALWHRDHTPQSVIGFAHEVYDDLIGEGEVDRATTEAIDEWRAKFCPSFNKGWSQEEAVAVITHWRRMAALEPFDGRGGENDRKAVLAVLSVGLRLGRTRFDLGDREAAQLAGMPPTNFQRARQRVSKAGYWFTWHGESRRWENGHRLAGGYHVRENVIPNDPRLVHARPA